ncbi:polyprenyl diphosphate synthase [Candidatus Pelagibacter sp. HIMB1495]|uniref:polyprenyl diphosphate synthase n=1 Tax=unclassified Candidatus Pelagibacter TaxID=2647897 RepID=UPI003F84AB04
MNPLNHVAIIMDGNGRWGIKHFNSRNRGHKEGLKTVEKVIKHSINTKIPYLTLFAFSTENWKRPKTEVNFLFKLLENFLKKKIDEFNKHQIKLKIIGEKKFPKKLNKLLNDCETKTKKNSKLQINLALNYGSRNEIINAIRLLKKNKIKISEKNISKLLYTRDIPDPDLLIRTGNTKRLSNFLLWQISYSEIFFSKKLWPDFNIKDFQNILNKYNKIKRNFGKI